MSAKKTDEGMWGFIESNRKELEVKQGELDKLEIQKQQLINQMAAAATTQTDKAIKAIDKQIANEKEQVKQLKDGIDYLTKNPVFMSDTETTGTDVNDVLTSFATQYSLSKKSPKSGMMNFGIGKDGKDYSRQMLQKAMNIPAKGGGFAASALQYRKKFGIRQTTKPVDLDKIASKTFERKYAEYYKNSYQGTKGLLEAINKYRAEEAANYGAALAFYNAEFDKRLIRQTNEWFKNNKPEWSVSDAELEKALAGTLDVFDDVIAQELNMIYLPQKSVSQKMKGSVGLAKQEYLASIMGILADAHIDEDDVRVANLVRGKMAMGDKSLKNLNTLLSKMKPKTMSATTKGGTQWDPDYKNFAKNLGQILRQNNMSLNTDADVKAAEKLLGQYAEALLQPFSDTRDWSTPILPSPQVVAKSVQSMVPARVGGGRKMTGAEFAKAVYSKLPKEYQKAFTGENGAAKNLRESGLKTKNIKNITSHGFTGINNKSKTQPFATQSAGDLTTRIADRITQLGGTITAGEFENGGLTFYINSPDINNANNQMDVPILFVNDNGYLINGKQGIKNIMEIQTNGTLLTVNEEQLLGVLNHLLDIDSLSELKPDTLANSAKYKRTGKMSTSISNFIEDSTGDDIYNSLAKKSGEYFNSAAPGMTSYKKLAYYINQQYGVAYKQHLDKTGQMVDNVNPVTGERELVDYDDANYLEKFGMYKAHYDAGTLDTLLERTTDSIIKQLSTIDELNTILERLSQSGAVLDLSSAEPRLFNKGLFTISGYDKYVPGTSIADKQTRITAQALQSIKKFDTVVEDERENVFATRAGIEAGLDYASQQFQLQNVKYMSELEYLSRYNLLNQDEKITGAGLPEDTVAISRDTARIWSVLQTQHPINDYDTQEIFTNFANVITKHLTNSEDVKNISKLIEGELQSVNLQEPLKITQDIANDLGEFSKGWVPTENDILYSLENNNSFFGAIIDKFMPGRLGDRVSGLNAEKGTIAILNMTQQRFEELYGKAVDAVYAIPEGVDVSVKKNILPLTIGRVKRAYKKLLEDGLSQSQAISTFGNALSNYPILSKMYSVDGNFIFDETEGENIIKTAEEGVALLKEIEPFVKEVLTASPNANAYQEIAGQGTSTINIQDILHYEENTGFGSNAAVAVYGRAYFEDKNREATIRQLELMRGKVVDTLQNTEYGMNKSYEELKEEYNKFIKNIYTGLNQSNPERTRAQKYINTIKKTMEATLSSSSKGLPDDAQIVKILANNVKSSPDATNEILIKNILTDLEYLEGGKFDGAPLLYNVEALIANAIEASGFDAAKTVLEITGFDDKNISQFYLPGYDKTTMKNQFSSLYLPAGQMKGKGFDEIGKSLNYFITKLQDAEETGESDITNAVKQLYEDMNKLANDNHSTLVKASKVSYLKGSGYSTMRGEVGEKNGSPLPDGYVGMNPQDIAERFELLSTSYRNDFKALSHIINLYTHYFKEAGAAFKQRALDINSGVSSNKQGEIYSLYNEVKDAILTEWENGNLPLHLIGNRWPTIMSRMGEYPRILADATVQKGAIAVNKAFADTELADFDNDKFNNGIAELNMVINDGALIITDVISTLQADTANMISEIRTPALREPFKLMSSEQLANAIPYHDLTEEQMQKLGAGMADTKENRIGAITSKTDFHPESVSNISTAIRHLVDALGLAGNWVGETATAFFQSIEQTLAISSKNKDTSLGNWNPNLIDNVRQYALRGDLQGMIQIIKASGNIGDVLKGKDFAKSWGDLAQYNPEAIKTLTDKGYLVTDDSNNILGVKLEAAMEAMAHIESMFGGVNLDTGVINHFNDWKSVVYGNGVPESTLKFANVAKIGESNSVIDRLKHRAQQVETKASAVINTVAPVINSAVNNNGNSNIPPRYSGGSGGGNVEDIISKSLEEGFYKPLDYIEKDLLHNTTLGEGVMSPAGTSVTSIAGQLNKTEAERAAEAQGFINSFAQAYSSSSNYGNYMHKLLELQSKYSIPDAKTLTRELSGRTFDIESQNDLKELNNLQADVGKNYKDLQIAANGIYDYLQNTIFAGKQVQATFTEKGVGGIFKDDKYGVSGVADLINVAKTIDGKWEADIVDYKRSADNSPQKLAERFYQTSADAQMYAEKLQAEFDEYQKTGKIGTELKAFNEKIGMVDGQITNEMQAAIDAIRVAKSHIARYSPNGKMLDIETNTIMGRDELFNSMYNLTREIPQFAGETAGEPFTDAQKEMLRIGLTKGSSQNSMQLDTTQAQKDWLDTAQKMYNTQIALNTQQEKYKSAFDENGNLIDIKAANTAAQKIAQLIVKMQEYVDLQRQAAGGLAFNEDGTPILTAENQAKYDRMRMGYEATTKTKPTLQQQQDQQSADALASAQAQANALSNVNKQILMAQAEMKNTPQKSARFKELEAELSLLQQQAQTYKTSIDYQTKLITNQRDQQIFQAGQVQLQQDYNKAQAQAISQMAVEKSYIGGLFTQFKQTLSFMVERSLAYAIVGEIKKVFQTLIQTTQQLDAALVNVQIATSDTRAETTELLQSYVDLAKQLGRTTTEVAVASNDWLRAGYRGKDVAELTEASMKLSTLGMIEASSATTYLISTLKGWKLEVSEVAGVVDKLSAIDMQAAISSGELANAMSYANNAARLAGVSMNNYIGMVTTVKNTTQKSAETVGNAFKTLFSRFGNVKAGKYAANADELNSDEYDSEEFTQLNDIETVLSTVNIKVRQNAATWRDVDDILDDIGKKWSAWDTTTQNAVATAIAGTRQREVVVSLFENWEDVAKYAEIAEESYGTATKKMEAYSDSIEAAKNRMTAAIEELILDLNGADVFKIFYDKLGFVIENIGAFGKSLLIITTLLKPGLFAKPLITLTTRMSSIMMNAFNNFGGKLSGYSSAFKQGGIGGMFNTAKNNIATGIGASTDAAFINAEQKKYAIALGQATLGLNEETRTHLQLVQKGLIAGEASTTETVAKLMLGQITQEEAISSLSNITSDQQMLLAQTLLTAGKYRELTESADYRTAVQNGTGAQWLLNAALEQLTLDIQGNSAAYKAMGGNLLGHGATNKNTALASGTVLMLGGFTGSMLGSSIGNALGGDNGKMYGTMLGGLFGSTITQVATAAGGPLAGGVAAAVMGVIGLIMNKANQTYEDAKDTFTQAKERYESVQNMGSVADKLIDLSDGVDELGNNISLTEDEYKNYLDYSNQLGTAFPQLISYIDEEGNTILKLNGVVDNTTGTIMKFADAVDQAIENSKATERAALLDPDLIEKNLINAQKDYEKKLNAVVDAEKTLTNMQTTQEFRTNPNYQSNTFESEYAQTTYYSAKDYYDSFADGQNITLTELGAQMFKNYDEALAAYKALDDEWKNGDKNRRAEIFTEIDAAKQLVDYYRDYIGSEWTNNYHGALYTDEGGVIGTEDYQSEAAIEEQVKLVQELKQELQEAAMAMSDEAVAQAEKVGAYKGLTESEAELMTSAVKSVSMFDESGNRLDYDTYLKNVSEMADKIRNLIYGDTTYASIALKIDGAATAEAAAAARQELLQALLAQFGDNLEEGSDGYKIIVGLGFKLDDKGNWTDTQDYITLIKDKLISQGLSDVEANDWIKERGINSMSTEDAGVVYSNMNAVKFKIDKNSSAEAVSDLFINNTGASSLETSKAYSAQLINGMDDFESRINEFYGTITKDTQDLDYLVYQNFHDLPENIQNSIISGAESVQEALSKDTSDLQKQADKEKAILNAKADDWSAYSAAVLNSQKNTAKILAGKYFKNVDTGTDGIIGEWSELSDMLDTISTSYEKLKDARKEEVSSGRLSWETTLDLLDTNIAYAQALRVTEKGIGLKTDAEKIMAQVQISTARANIQAKIAVLKARNADIQAMLDQYETEGIIVESTNDSIDANASMVESLNTLSDGWANAAAEAQYYARVAKAASEGNYDLVEQLEKEKPTEAASGNHVEAYREYVKYDADDAKNKAEALKQEMLENEDTIKILEAFDADLEKVEDSGYSSNVFTKLMDTPDGSDSKEAWERVKEVLEAVNKEYKQMIASTKLLAETSKLASDSAKSYFDSMSTEYYDKMRDLYNVELQALQKSPYYGKSLEEISAAGYDDDTLSDALEVYKEVENIKINIANLDDEEVQDRIDLLEIYGQVNDKIIEEYRNLVATADTLPERIEYEKKLNDKLREQVELVKELKQYEKEVLDFRLEYESGTPTTQAYQDLIDEIEANLEAQLADAEAAAQAAYDAAYQSLINQGYSPSQAAAKAYEDPDYRASMEDWMEAYQAIGDLYMQQFKDRADALERKIKELETSKPNKWGSDWNKEGTSVTTSAISKIKDYYGDVLADIDDNYIKNLTETEMEALSGLNGYYVKIAREAYDTLTNYSDKLTDEQIATLTEKYNDAMKNIRDNSVSLLEDIKNYQESVYSALTSEVGRYKEQLEKQKDIVEDYYDKELEKLNDKNEAIERTNKLLELQQNLLNAQQEKQRVFRSGIGWVYESDRTKIKTAQDDLSQFYLQDSIDDLNNAKDAELKALDERIQNWNDYLEMLETKYEEYDRLQEQKLLMETLGLESQEAVEAAIKADMLDFTQYMAEHVDDFFDNQITAFSNFNTTFDTFLQEYKSNLEELYALNISEVNTISAEDYMGDNSVTMPTIGAKKIDNTQTLYEVVLNDKSLKGTLKGVGSEYYDSNGYVDYDYTIRKNLESGDVYQAGYDLALRKAKVEGLLAEGNTEYEQYDFKIDDYVAELAKEYNLNEEAIKSFKNAYVNAQTVTNNINKQNAGLTEDIREIESQTAQVTLAFATSLPAQLSEQQALTLQQMVEANITNKEGFDNVGLSVSDSLGTTATNISDNMEKNKDAIVEQLTKIYEEIYTDEEAAAAYESYTGSSYSGGGSAHSALADATFTNTKNSYSDTSGGGGGSSTKSGISASDVQKAYNDINTGKSGTGAARVSYLTEKYGADVAKAAQQAINSAYSGTSVSTAVANATNNVNKANGYANGIEGGPVTYTGLAMLHGTPESPEYVLNSDQAYNLLRYMSLKQPKFESNVDNNNNGDNWTLNGDIVLENCDDPAQFWNEVTKAMSNRFNVTKNRK